MLVMASCDDFLDVKPKGKLIPETVTDYDNLLNYSGISGRSFTDNNQGSFIPYLTDDLKMSEAMEKFFSTHPNIDRYNAFVFSKPYKNQTRPDGIWDQSFKNIMYLNVIIKDIDATVKTKDDEKFAGIVKSQALLARAWHYFNMVHVYGPVYNPNSDNSSKVFPLVTDPDIGSKIPDLATTKEVFKFVLNDVYAALPTLPEKVKHPSRASTKAGYAMLANIHMFTQQWDSVAYYSEKAWAGVGNLYDYNKFSFDKPEDPDNVKVIGIERRADNKENLFYRFSINNAGVNDSYVSDELVQIFTPEDLRFKYFYRERNGKEDDKEIQQQFQANKFFPTTGFSHPEVLLMRAEAYARTNQRQKAIDDLNILRKYRYETGTAELTLGSLSQDEVTKLVLDERRKELAFRTLKRFLDLKRFSLEVGKPWHKDKVIHTIGATQYEGTIADKFQLKIPKVIEEYNKHWIE